MVMYQQRANMYEGLFNVQTKFGRRARLKWEDNIKMDFHEVGWGSMDWIVMAQDWESWWTLVNAVMNLRVP
jgi:hypothetical protein